MVVASDDIQGAHLRSVQPIKGRLDDLVRWNCDEQREQQDTRSQAFKDRLAVLLAATILVSSVCGTAGSIKPDGDSEGSRKLQHRQ